MKKIMISAIVTPSDNSVTLKSIQDALRHHGSAYFTFGSEIELANSEGMSGEVWLYVSSDDSEPYVKVSGPGEIEGTAVSDDDADRFRKEGVCTEFHAQYPRADKYGTPPYATDDDFAAGVVGDHLFKVAAEGLSVFAEDRGDDGGEGIWLKIALPA